ADVLTGADQTVYMPDTVAGCPMADMADVEQATTAWRLLQQHGGDWLPVVYVNSSAAIKSFCGENGGSTCTSSNARRVFEWVFAQNKRVLFLPDEHLGVNTAVDMGIPEEQVGVFDPAAADGGPSVGDLDEVRVVVWKGYCLVHAAFTKEHIRRVREKLPQAKIIVHPEVPREVTSLADASGSTSRIIKYVEEAPDGETIVVGTEINLVERLAREQAGRVSVKALSPSVCANMARTNVRNLLAVLTDWPGDNEVHVLEKVAGGARKALTTMLEL
ncbi:MAG: quinolinate synthase NadA, partial [Lentisphaerae bacterium]|nr:quinolinate synthase NadA [Lentisphaerota bacterium]